jgi:hypothetical protein
MNRQIVVTFSSSANPLFFPLCSRARVKYQLRSFIYSNGKYRMRKGIVLYVSLIFGLAFLLFVGVTVRAQIGVDVRFNAESLTTVVNQPIEFTATASMGTPPYSYQWYTQLWTTWKLGMPFPLPPLGPEVAVPGATSSKFEFVASSPGTYGISINVTDSAGNSVYDVFQPGGIWVFVLASPTSTPTPATPIATPTPSEQSNSEPFPTTLVIASILSVTVIGVGLLIYFKKRSKGRSP